LLLVLSGNYSIKTSRVEASKPIKKPSGLVQMDRTARLYRQLTRTSRSVKPRELWKRDWSK